MAMANPTVGRNSLHIDCDRSASVSYRLENDIYHMLIRTSLFFIDLSLICIGFCIRYKYTFNLEHLSHVKIQDISQSQSDTN